MNTQTYVEHLRDDTERFAEVLEDGPRDAAVAACPGWDVAQLAVHLGSIHRWARAALVTAAAPTIDPDVPADEAALADWLRAGAAVLADDLLAADPDAPTWHPFPVERVARVWPRRQAIETVLHRWDAERAVGSTTPIDATLASDGIDEYFELGLPRLIVREGLALPSGSLHVHCTDVPGEWLVVADGEGLHLRREHAKGDAALRGGAEAVLLALWSRLDLDEDGLEVIGDRAVAEAWLALPGM